MSSKQKIAMTAVVAVLVLAIAGLTIGLILVASQATISGSMSVQYYIEEVECRLEASGKNYTSASDSEGSVIKLLNKDNSQYDKDSITIDVAKGDTSTMIQERGTIDFESITLTGDGRTVYMFTIFNTTELTENIPTINATLALTVTDLTTENDNDGVTGNVAIRVATSLAGLSEEGALLTGITATADLEGIVKDGNGTFYVECKVADPTLPANAKIDTTISITAQKAQA